MAGLIALIALSGCEKPTPPEPASPPAPAAPARVETGILRWIAEGDESAVRSWLADAPRLDERGPDQVTPLIAASLYGRTPITRLLLEAGANPGLVDLHGSTALHVAAQHGRTEIVRLLLTHGADPHTPDFDGLTPFDVAMMLGHPDTAAVIDEARRVTPGAPATPSGPDLPPDLDPVLLSTEFRIWTSASGQSLDAAFIQSIFDTIILQRRDGTLVRIGINRLAPADQIAARALAGIDPHALAAARLRSPASAATPRTDSIALKIGRDKGWTVLENCRLLKRSGNDGDSFHVQHDGKEYIFRLYFVDAAETSDAYPDRVDDQATYFGLDRDATLRLGKEASKFTASVLAGIPFTVVTQWADARGNSRLPRHYAMIVTPLGDLDELLVREGLVRRYGMPVDTGQGRRKMSLLKQLEAEAKREHAGAWSKQDSRRAADSGSPGGFALPSPSPR